jgi:hypothetical protein
VVYPMRNGPIMVRVERAGKSSKRRLTRIF